MEKEYKGIIKLKNFGESDDILTLDNENPLARLIADDIEEHGNFLTVRYFVSDKEKLEEELNENLIKKICGSSEADYGEHYSEMTGYLWTDNEINVGGHNLIKELENSEGKFCYLMIKYSTNPL